MADPERLAKCVEILRDAGWGKRKDESGRMYKIFEPDPFGQSPLVDEPLWPIDADKDIFDIQPSKIDNKASE